MSYDRIERLVFPDEDLVGIVAALPSNSKVILAAGTHVIANPVTISAKTNFSIEGMPGATISYAGAQYAIRLTGACADITLKGFSVTKSNAAGNVISTSPGAGVTMERIRIVGITALGSGGTAFSLSGSATGLLRDVIVRDCIVNGAYAGGITIIYQFDGVSFLNNTFRSSLTTGFCVSTAFGGTSGNVVISGNKILSGFSVGIALGTSATKVIVSDNVIVGNASMTIGVSFSGENILVKGNLIQSIGTAPNGQGIAGSGDYNVIEGNEIRLPGLQGIFYGGSNGIIATNHIYDPGDDGILLSSSPGVEGDNVVQGNEVYSPGNNGIRVYGHIRVNVHGGVIDTPASNGVAIDNGSTYCLVRGVVVRNAGNYGVLCGLNCNHVTIEDCRVVSPTSGGIGCASGSDYIQIVGNSVTGSGLYGIEVNSSPYFQVNANHVSASVDDGIHLSGSNNGQCNDNQCVSNGSDGIAVLSCDECVVDGNRCYNNSAYGILEDANCDQCLYGVNHLRGNVTGASSYNGTNRTEAGNKT